MTLNAGNDARMIGVRAEASGPRAWLCARVLEHFDAMDVFHLQHTTSMIHDHSMQDVPWEYLQAYPFPAFVVAVTPDRVDDVWSNERWQQATSGAGLDVTLGRRGKEDLKAWLQGLPVQGGYEDRAIRDLALINRDTVVRVTKTPLRSASTSRQGTSLYAVTAIDPPRQSSVPDAAQPLDSPPVSVSQPPAARSRSHTRHRSHNAGRSPLSTTLDTENNTSLLSPPLLMEQKPLAAVQVGPELNCRRLLETTDWSLTSLGSREGWSPVVHTMTDLLMRSPTQDSLWLGPDFNMIYNQHYTQIVHHPAKFGASAKAEDAWGPVWNDVLPVIKRCYEFGESCHFQDDLLLYRRGPTGHFVEKYHTWSFIPIFDADRKPLGLFNPTLETTAAVLARRRQETLRDVSEQVSLARTTGEFYEGVRNVLEKNAKDIPFMAFYSTAGNDQATVDLHLQASVGVPDNHPSCPAQLSASLRAARPNLAPFLSSPTPSSMSLSSANSVRTLHSDLRTNWPIVPALAASQCVVMDDCSALIEGFPLRQWDHLPQSAIMLPIAPDRSSSTPDAVMILGLNLQCPLDAAYEEWIHLLRAHLTSALASVKGIELAEQRRLERERMSKAQTAWFQGAAHDLRSPLTLVAGPLGDVLETHLTGFQRHSLTLAQRNVARIQRLVNALLDFSRIEAGRLTGHFFSLDLGAFVSDIAHLFSPAAVRRQLDYDISVEASGPSVWFDPTLMETAITNLISNAVKYTKKGRIGVSLKYSSSHAIIAISDTGCGIPKAELESVTSRFNRASTALNAGVEGTGIGLALTKELIKIHDGELSITSRTEIEAKQGDGGSHGSTFTVRIPLVDRLNEVESGTSSNDREVGAYGRQLALEAMALDNGQSQPDYSHSVESIDAVDRGDGFLFEPSDTLLLVDDSDDIRAYIKRIFAPYCKIIEAGNGEEALHLAQTMTPKPNLILSDLMMPRMNGSELLMAIRDHPATRRIPMVLLSAAPDEESRLSALTKGAEDFISKPFKPKELLARVHLHMQLGKKRADLEDMFALREQELQVLSDYCPSGIMRADEKGTLVYANAAWKTYVGMPQDGDINTYPDYVDEPTLRRIVSMWEKLVAGDLSEMQVTWTWLNGITVTGNFVRLASAIGDGRWGIVGCLQDITYQEERLHEAERRRVEAEEAKRQQELLVDMTSHEIRTPVSAILQCSALVKENMEALRKELVEAGTAGYVIPAHTLAEFDRDLEALESIYQCGLVQERIAGDVLSLARIQLDVLSMHYTSTNIRQEAQKRISAFAAEAKMKKIEVAVEFSDAFEALGVSHLLTDHVRLGQIITNLVSNAIRFTANSAIRRIVVSYDLSVIPPEDGTCEVPAACGPVRDVVDGTPLWLFVGVKDTGPGLTEHERNILFQRFTQGNKMIHSQYGGSGLGLFICRKISEIMGGRIEVKSQLGAGSTFRFFIQTSKTAPIEQAASPERRRSSTVTLDLRPGIHSAVTSLRLEDGQGQADGEAMAAHVDGAANGLNQAVKDGADLGKLRIMIVEDNLINQTVLQRQLTKTGWLSDVASNGQEALDRIAHARSDGAYDAILMDLEMPMCLRPVMDGLTALDRIRDMERDGKLEKQLVIALTGNAREAQVQQALDAGMDDVMIKPYRLPELVGKVKRLVEAKRGRI